MRKDGSQEVAVEAEGPDAVLAALDPEQRQVAQATRGPVCVVAGAGTGKTRAVAHRIAYAVRTGVVNPGNVLAVTFTTRAAGELRGRLRQLGGPSGTDLERVAARTFHSAALRQLTHFWPLAVGGRPPAVVDSKIGLLSEAARGLRLRPGVAELRDVAGEIEWSKVTQVRPDGYEAAAAKAGRTPPLGREAVGRLFGAYEQLRRERHLVDFESVLELTAAILAEHPQASAEVRDRYRYFVVDEYQDVNPLQKLLLDTWAGERDDVCVVGDPRQTIYSFAGATSEYLTGFTADFPHATVVRLVRNYRSTPQVVELANRLTGATGGRADGWAGRKAAAAQCGGAHARDSRRDGGPALAAQRDEGPAPEFTEYGDETAEAVAVAARARKFLARGLAARQIAVLVRANAQTERFERAFAEAGVPCQVRGTERFFDRAVVRQAVQLLRAAAKSMSAEALAGESPARRVRLPQIAGLGEGGASGAGPGEGCGGSAGPGEGTPGAAGAVRRQAAAALAGAAGEVRHVLAGLGLTPDPPAGRGAARERWESLAALAQLAEELCVADPRTAFADIVAEITHRAAIEHAPEVEGVTVASLHAAKGLEWDVVFLPGLTEGNLPIVHAETEEAVAEERRLFYVGITRAREQVFLSWPLARSPGGRRTRQPSRFLAGLRPRRPLGRTTPALERRSVAGRAGARAGRAVPGGEVDMAEGKAVEGGLAQRLREWRQQAARGAGVPAYVVFSDETLRRLADDRPATSTDLARIPGFGPVRLERYGAAVLALCAGTPKAPG